MLAVGAHFDDVEIGCGGTLLSWRQAGHTIGVFVATTSGYTRPDGRVIRSPEQAQAEGRRAAEALGAQLFEGGLATFGVGFDETTHRLILAALDEFRPDVVLTHWRDDAHHDHSTLGLATVHCCRRIPRVLAYHSNWDLSPGSFEPRFFVDVEATLEGKIELVKLYSSEFARTEGRWESAIRARARDHGERAGCSYAEGFEVVRWLAPAEGAL